MLWASCVILLTGAYPLWRAMRAVRGTSMTHAVWWGAAAWAAWVVLDLIALFAPGWVPEASYLALSLTSCVAVAVLGARRPHVGAWDFVVLALLAVLLLQLFERSGGLRESPVRILFLGATLAVGLVNYLPTRLGPAVLLLGVGCTVVFLRLTGSLETELTWVLPAIGISPWAGLLAASRPRPGASAFDRDWLAFRDAYGLVWSQRVREQFNRSVANNELPVQLGWRGAREIVDASTEAAMRATLHALLKRFGLEESATDEHR